MGFTAGWINFETVDEAQFTVVIAFSDAAFVQCYRNDELVDGVAPDGRSVQVGVDRIQFGQYIRLLAVDLADSTTNFFSTAWPNDLGNRITVKTPTEPGWLPGELWRVYLDDTQIYEQEIWIDPEGPAGLMGCRGTERGVARGLDAYGSGRGHWRGVQRGYEPFTLIHETDVLAPGTYEIAATTIDNAGNETTQTEDTRTHNTYPGEPAGLLVTAFNSGTGLTTLTWTESPDVG